MVQLLDSTSVLAMVPLALYLEIDFTFQRVQRAQLSDVVSVLFQKIALQAQLNSSLNFLQLHCQCDDVFLSHPSTYITPGTGDGVRNIQSLRKILQPWW